ncbi:Hypothetical predicted protein [Mytilus galloprovincialis]|uniref:Uncharacterized protein n=1 Tax=Mytilus galloprovincialis TaxID=29158 RepID=A0A8B6DZU7_MYTGA|nr:Hypothetical predicted protein [Mytilus galloprovincialis]
MFLPEEQRKGFAQYYEDLSTSIPKEEKKVPTSFKSGILTPVLKKDKDSTELGNYRGITVTPVTGKTFEYSFLTKLNLESKTDLQFGFTKGLSPIMASLIISEARYEEKKGSENF